MRRREFITLLVSAAATWAVTVRAQQSAMPGIGYLGTGSAELNAGSLRAFRQGLKEIGYIEGQNLAIEYRWAEGHYDRLPALAADLVGRKVDLIMVGQYAGNVLKGAKLADLPVQQPTTFELVINLKTAKALKLTIPQPILLRADEVIQ